MYMNNNKIINLSDGVDDGDAMNKKQINEYVEQQTIFLKDALPSKLQIIELLYIQVLDLFMLTVYI